MWVSRPVALLLPDAVDKLQQLAGRLDTLEPGQVIGELEAIKAMVFLAASSVAVSPMAPDPFALLTDEAVAEVLSVPTRTVVLLRQRGLLPGVPVGDKYVRTRRRDLETFVASLPTTLYSRKYASQPHAHSSAALDAQGDVASPAPSSRLHATRARRGVRRHSR
jgi:hypothetical protein